MFSKFKPPFPSNSNKQIKISEPLVFPLQNLPFLSLRLRFLKSIVPIPTDHNLLRDSSRSVSMDTVETDNDRRFSRLSLIDFASEDDFLLSSPSCDLHDVNSLGLFRPTHSSLLLLIVFRILLLLRIFTICFVYRAS